MKKLFVVFIAIITALFLYPIIDTQIKNAELQTKNLQKSKIYNIEKISVLYENTNIIKEMSYKDYLIGCLFAQIPSFYEHESLKAQAIVANTYSIYLMMQNNKSKERFNADFSDNPDLFQPYLCEEKAIEYYGEAYDAAYKRLSDAVDFGINYIITYDDKPIYTAFHNISSRITDDKQADFPYLKSVNSTWDRTSKEFSGSKQMSTSAVRGAFMKYFKDIRLPTDYNEWFSDLTYADSGTLLFINIGGYKITGDELAKILSLRSANIEITYNNNFFTFKTKGYGNNIGLSIYGGNQMAKDGANCASILHYYYTDIRIEEIPDM